MTDISDSRFSFAAEIPIVKFLFDLPDFNVCNNIVGFGTSPSSLQLLLNVLFTVLENLFFQSSQVLVLIAINFFVKSFNKTVF